MGATALTAKLHLVGLNSEVKDIELYSKYTDFMDYGIYDNNSYLTVCVGNSGGTTSVGYLYASTILYTNTAGDVTSNHVFDYMGANGVIMHAYAKQPNESEEVVETFSSATSTETILIDDATEFPFGAYVYVVNTKGNNGNSGSSGGAGSGSYTGGLNAVSRGSGGSGGSGGSAGKTTSVTLSFGEFLEDGTADWTNATNYTLTQTGEYGAGGGGGGGGAGYYYYSYLGNSVNKTAGAVGSGGSGGTASVVARYQKNKIFYNEPVKITKITIATASGAGSTGSSGSGGGSSTGSAIGSASITGGSGGKGGSNGAGTAGASGASYSSYNGGKGGTGASCATARGQTTVTNEYTKYITTGANSSTNGTSALASTGGVLLAKINLTYDE